MKILVTGAAGFIGYHLIKRLAREADILGIDNFDPYYDPYFKKVRIEELSMLKRFEFKRVDIRDSNVVSGVLKEFSPEVVIHLAARAGVRSSIDDPETYFDINVKGTISLLEAMRKNSIKKLLFASSSSVYGGCKELPFRETNESLKPLSPYGISKLSCEHYIRCYHDIYGIDSLSLRIFTCYGPEQRPDMAFHKFARNILDGKPIILFNNGEPRRDFTFVSDCVEYFCRSLQWIMSQQKRCEVLNIGGANPVKIGYALELLQNNLGKKPIIETRPLSPYEPDVTFADNSRALKLLNYKPKVGLDDGIREFSNWIKKRY